MLLVSEVSYLSVRVSREDDNAHGIAVTRFRRAKPRSRHRGASRAEFARKRATLIRFRVVLASWIEQQNVATI